MESNNSLISKETLADNIREEFAGYGIMVKTIYLFGSRATGKVRPDSDWDFLVITSKKLDRSVQRKIVSHIRKKFIFDYNIDSDILVITESAIPSILDDKGRISYYAIWEGIML